MPCRLHGMSPDSARTGAWSRLAAPRFSQTNRSPRGRSNVSTSNSSVIWRPYMIRIRRTRVPTRTRPRVSSSIAVTDPMIRGQFLISVTVLKTAGGLAATVL